MEAQILYVHSGSYNFFSDATNHVYQCHRFGIYNYHSSSLYTYSLQASGFVKVLEDNAGNKIPSALLLLICGNFSLLDTNGELP